MVRMAAWWKKLRSAFSAKTKDPEPTPKPTWEEPSDGSPFDYPVLALWPITGKMLSFSQDPMTAERAISWGSSVGDDLITTELQSLPEQPCNLVFPADPLLTDGLLFTPTEMEDKWVLALRGQQLIAARSWTGTVEVLASVRREKDELLVTGVRFTKDSGLGVFGDPISVFDWLVRTHALNQQLPLPVDSAGANLLEEVPLAVFSSFGNRAAFAAKHWDPPNPTQPLRADGRVMRAVQHEDYATLRKLSAAGESLVTPSPTCGFTPLILASINGDKKSLALLLELGADVNGEDDNGLFPLGHAIVHGHGIDVLSILTEAGADLEKSNEDGFGVLHAAAECDRADIIPWLIDIGVELEARTNNGHTALHIACGLGHLNAAKALLECGADPTIRAGDGDASAIARKEGNLKIVKLLVRHKTR